MTELITVWSLYRLTSQSQTDWDNYGKGGIPGGEGMGKGQGGQIEEEDGDVEINEMNEGISGLYSLVV